MYCTLLHCKLWLLGAEWQNLTNWMTTGLHSSQISVLVWKTWSLSYLWHLQACWMVFAALLALCCSKTLLPAIKMLSANLFCLWERQAASSVLAAACSALWRSLIARCLSSFLCSSSGQYNDLALVKRVKNNKQIEQEWKGCFSPFCQLESPVSSEVRL